MNKQEATDIIYNYLACFEAPCKADAVFAFGSYHQPVAQTAAQLILDKYAPILICSGASTPLTQNVVKTSEADFFADIAFKMGVVDEQILREPNSFNTGENIILSMKLLREKGIKAKTILACAMPAHLRRIVVTFAKLEPQIKVVPILVPFEPEDYRTREGLSFEKRLVSELARLRVYPERGFTTPLEFPKEVIEAEDFINNSQST